MNEQFLKMIGKTIKHIEEITYDRIEITYIDDSKTNIYIDGDIALVIKNEE